MNKTQSSELHIIKKDLVAKMVDRALGNNASDDIITTKPVLNQRWEDLDRIYNDLAESIATISISVSDVVNKYKEASPTIPAEVGFAVKALFNDLTNMTEDLMTIKASHTGKIGVVKTDEDLAILLETFSKYQLLFDRFKALTFQELLVITEHTMSIRPQETGPVTVEGEVVKIKPENTNSTTEQ